MRYKKEILPNGLRLLMVPVKESPSITVSIMAEVGSKYENKKNNGISHFLEHMAFKGTKKRPTSLHISKELDSLGARNNAYTSNEVTGYWAKAKAAYLPDIFDVVSDIYLNSTFPEREVEKEKGVILGEIDMYEDTPARDVSVQLLKLMYKNQPAGFDVLGSKENIKSFTRRDFIDYKAKHYVPQSTLIVISGNFDPRKAGKMVRERFGSIPKARKFPKKKTEDRQRRPEAAVKRKKTDQTHLAIGVRAYDMRHPSLPALMVLNAVLGRGMSSRLWHKMREEMGIGYYVGSGVNDFTDHGYLAAYAGVKNDRLGEAVGAVVEEFKKLKTSEVEKRELEKAKRFIIGNMYLGLETAGSVGSFYGDQEIFKLKIKTPAEVEKEIKKVSAKDVKKVANEIFRNKNLNLAVVGPVKDGGKLLSLLKI